MKLIVQNLSFKYGKRKILDDVSLKVEPGEIIGIIGDNGSGKTTFLKLLCDFLKPCSGNIFFEELTPGKIRTAGILEEPHLYNQLTGRENLQFYLRKYYSEEKAVDFFQRFNMSDAIDLEVKNYSLGMKQKLSIMVALMSDAEIFVFDEPTNSIDENCCAVFFEILKEYASAGKIIFIVTHILINLNKYCTRMLLAKAGKLEEWKDYCQTENIEVVRLEFETNESAEKICKSVLKDDVIGCKNNIVLVSTQKFPVAKIVEKTCKYGIIGVQKQRKKVLEFYEEAENDKK